MKINELIKTYYKLNKSNYGINNNQEIIDDTIKYLSILGILVKNKVDIYTEFLLSNPSDYEEYCLKHEYKYGLKNKLTLQEFVIIKEALNDLI